MKKIFILLMLLQVAALSMHSATFTYQNLNYEIISETEKTVSVAGNSSATGEVEIPAIAKNNNVEYNVTSIGKNAFSGCSGLISVTIAPSVTSIGSHAFDSCTGLTNMTIPNSVTSIESYAFYGCSGLTNITISNSVTSIEKYAFSKCSILTNITIPNSVTSIGESAFRNCTSLKDLRFEDGEEALKLDEITNNQEVFYKCPLETLYLGRNLSYNNSSSYGYSPFYNFTTLEQLTIGNSVTSIGNYIFYGCSGLTSVTIPNSVTSIGEYAFYGCSGLTSLIIGHSVSTIGDYVFSKCSRLASITIPNSVTSIGKRTFDSCTGLTSMTIPNSVVTIGNNAFSGCISLNDLRLEDGDETLTLGNNGSSKGLFSDCALEMLYLGRDLSYNNSNGYSPFYNITTLTQVVLGNTVTTIGELMFGNTGLSSITIGNAVNSIEANAFPSSLRIVTSQNPTPPAIKSNTFNSQTTQSGVLLVPESALINYQYAAYWNEFLKIEGFPNSGSGGSDDQGGESVFNTKVDRYIYMALDDEQTFTDYLPSDVSASSWKSSDDDIVEVTKRGKAEAYEYGNVIVRALDGEGNALLTLGVFVCPTVKIHYGTGKTYEHHVIYNSTPSFYIAAPDDYEIISVEHDGADVTEAVLANEGYYTPASPIIGNSTIKVSLLDTRDPSDLNGDGVVDVSDLNFLIERIMNNN